MGHLGESGTTIWFTGLPSSGKSTIATGLADLFAAENQSRQQAARLQVLDGDELRRTLCKDLGYSRPDREENTRRIGDLALRLAGDGFLVLVAAIAPYASTRAQVRARHAAAGVPYFEMHVDAPVTVCSERDVKGLYAKQRDGRLHGLTGVDDPYEVPTAPDLRLRTDRESAAESIAKVYGLVSGLWLRQS